MIAMSFVPPSAGGRTVEVAVPASLLSGGERMAISKRQRFETFKRDKFTCQYCGRRPPDVMLEADHIVSRTAGGSDSLENLTTSCFDCNRGKGDHPLGTVAPAFSEDDRLAAMQEMLERKTQIEREIALADGKRDMEARAASYILDLWVEETGGEEGFQKQSVLTFLDYGLSIEALYEALRGAFRNCRSGSSHQRWRYFCGACWKMIKEVET